MSVRSVGVRLPVFALPALATLVVFGLPFQVQAQETVAATDVVTPLVATPLASPNPVLGSDDRTHLAYEIVLMNMAPSGKTTRCHTRRFCLACRSNSPQLGVGAGKP